MRVKSFEPQKSHFANACNDLEDEEFDEDEDKEDSYRDQFTGFENTSVKQFEDSHSTKEFLGQK